jgi:glycosyltransferase involved in cell wall biosynthesis
MKVSIVIPVYNEENRIAAAIEQVIGAQFPKNKEIIVVNDGSTDKTAEILKTFEPKGVTVVNQPANFGKGAALKEGFARVSGEIALVQDADLEYSVEDYPALLKPLFEGKADVVFGSRFIGGGEHRVLLFWHSIANRCLTTLSNMFTNLNLTDMEVGLKAFKTEIIKKIDLQEKRFGFEPEITAKVAKQRCRIYEVPISYYGRTHAEGKKIRLKDAIRALWCIFRYRFF